MATSTTITEVRSSIDAGNRAFMQAFARADAEALSMLYTEDAQLLPANSDFVTGRDAIRRFWGGVMEMGIAKVALQSESVESCGDTAYEVGRYTLETAAGEAADTGKYVLIWKHQGGAWRAHRDIWTTSRPAEG